MEIVQRFNASLSSLYDDKLPVSKTKISEITKHAIDGYRVYKHIVQSVELFIHKCRPEYKLPAVYVIDSIVRHSQNRFHQREGKDVFGQRFQRKFSITFNNLFATCLSDDKPKIVRVLNLWQKNKVYPPDVIQPLLDLAHPDAQLQPIPYEMAAAVVAARHHYHNNSTTLDSHQDSGGALSPPDHGSQRSGHSGGSGTGQDQLNVNRMFSEASAAMNAFGQLATTLTQPDDPLFGQFQQLITTLSQIKEQGQSDPVSVFQQLSQTNSNNVNSNATTDVDYRLSFNPSGNNNNLSGNQHFINDQIPMNESIDGDEDDDDISTPTEAEPPYPKSSKKQKQQQQQQQLQSTENSTSMNSFANLVQLAFQQKAAQQMAMLSAMNKSENGLTDECFNDVNNEPETMLQKFLNSTSVTNAGLHDLNESKDYSYFDHHSETLQSAQEKSFCGESDGQQQQSNSQSSHPIDENDSRKNLNKMDKNYYRESSSTRRYRRSRERGSKSRSPSADRGYSRSSSHRYHRRERSRSPSTRDSRYSSSSRTHRSSSSKNGDSSYRTRRSRSRSRSGSRSRATATAPTIIATPVSPTVEKAREKRRKGYPESKRDRMTICSTTLWFGHIPKRNSSEAELNDLLSEYGTVNSIDMIPSRGCAYVCMDRRQDAFKALKDLKNQQKILGSTQVKLTWAPGKGMKSKELKDYWDLEFGCSFIPIAELKDDIDLDALEEGGVIDEDTIPERLKTIRKQRQQQKELLEKQQVEQQQQQQQQQAAVAQQQQAQQQLQHQFAAYAAPGTIAAMALQHQAFQPPQVAPMVPTGSAPGVPMPVPPPPTVGAAPGIMAPPMMHQHFAPPGSFPGTASLIPNPPMLTQLPPQLGTRPPMLWVPPPPPPLTAAASQFTLNSGGNPVKPLHQNHQPFFPLSNQVAPLPPPPPPPPPPPLPSSTSLSPATQQSQQMMVEQSQCNEVDELSDNGQEMDQSDQMMISIEQPNQQSQPQDIEANWNNSIRPINPKFENVDDRRPALPSPSVNHLVAPPIMFGSRPPRPMVNNAPFDHVLPPPHLPSNPVMGQYHRPNLSLGNGQPGGLPPPYHGSVPPFLNSSDPFGPSLYELKSMEKQHFVGGPQPPRPMGPPMLPPPHDIDQFAPPSSMVGYHRPPLQFNENRQRNPILLNRGPLPPGNFRPRFNNRAPGQSSSPPRFWQQQPPLNHGPGNFNPNWRMNNNWNNNRNNSNRNNNYQGPNHQNFQRFPKQQHRNNNNYHQQQQSKNFPVDSNNQLVKEFEENNNIKTDECGGQQAINTATNKPAAAPSPSENGQNESSEQATVPTTDDIKTET